MAELILDDIAKTLYYSSNTGKFSSRKGQAFMHKIEREQQDTHNFAIPTPTFITIDGPLDEGKCLARPLVVQIGHDGEEILVSEPYFYIHASASTLPEAINEFKRILAEELDILTEDEKELGPRLRTQLQYLRSIIRTV